MTVYNQEYKPVLKGKYNPNQFLKHKIEMLITHMAEKYSDIEIRSNFLMPIINQI